MGHTKDSLHQKQWCVNYGDMSQGCFLVFRTVKLRSSSFETIHIWQLLLRILRLKVEFFKALLGLCFEKDVGRHIDVVPSMDECLTGRITVEAHGYQCSDRRIIGQLWCRRQGGGRIISLHKSINSKDVEVCSEREIKHRNH